MLSITMRQAVDYLECATITHTFDAGHAVVHVGVSEAGHRFVLINDMHGDTTVAETL